MANTHTTLSSLFTDIAGSIRSVTDTTSKYVADTFPKDIINLGKPVATQWTSKLDKILAPAISNVSTGSIVIIKAMCYYDGYWYGVGNDTNGDAWKMYGTTTGSMTAYKLATSRNYDATGIACDGTNIWICLSTGSYSNRTLLAQTITNFRSSSTSISPFVPGDYTFNAMAGIGGTRVIAVGGFANGSGAMVSFGNVSVTTNTSTYNTVVPESLVDCCVYNGGFVAVSSGGYIMQWADPNSSTAQYIKLDCLSGATKCYQMGNYLCVACVRNGATYLAYTSDTSVINGSWSCFKVANVALTVVGMAYANGLYTLIITNGNAGTTTTVWATTDIKDHGVYGKTMTLTSGYGARAIASGGNYICLLSGDGTNIQKALATIT